MQITVSTIQALQTSFSKIFRSAYRDTPTFWTRLATEVPSTTLINTYGWMQRLLQMREWIGPRVIQNLKSSSYTLQNKDYEATLAVDRNEIEDDMLGLFEPRTTELARVAARLPDQLVLAALLANGTGFDGVAMFSTAHPLDPAGNQSNLSSEAFTADNWQAVRARMRSYTGEDGRPLGVNPTLVVIPPAFEKRAKEIFIAERGSGGSTNVQQGEASYLVIPELTGNQWYVLDTSAPIKPFIYQLRSPVKLVSKTNLTDDNLFWQKEFVWGVDGRAVAGYGPWWLAHKSTGGLS